MKNKLYWYKFPAIKNKLDAWEKKAREHEIECEWDEVESKPAKVVYVEKQ